jgi:hypothetical protein
MNESRVDAVLPAIKQSNLPPYPIGYPHTYEDANELNAVVSSTSISILGVHEDFSCLKRI